MNVTVTITNTDCERRFYTAEWRWERESNIIVPTILPYEGKKTSNGLSANLGLQLEV